MLAIHNANLVLENGILWDGTLLVKDGMIAAFGKSSDIHIPKDAQVIDAEGAYVGPGFVDIHVHGGGGHVFEKDPLATADFFLRHGTTTILSTPCYDLTFSEFLEAIKKGKAAMKAGGAGRAIAGFYMEGPYMNTEYGACASHNPWRHSMDPKEYRALIEEAGEYAKVWAIAPEREVLQPFLEYARKVNPNVKFSIGHSEATPNQIHSIGSRYRPVLQTHCTNATGRVNAKNGIRGTGPDEYCLQDPEIYVELISDSCATHVRPKMQQLILRCKGIDRVVLITDSTVFDFPNPPEYSNIPDINFDDEGNVNGSKLTMDQACRNIMTHTNCGITQAFLMASRNPTRVIGLDHEIGTIEEGKKANLVIVDDRFNIKKVLLEGSLVE